MRWEDVRLGVVGGDEREQEIARLAAATGAGVRAFGFPWPADGIDGVTLAASPEDALRGARFALFPIPGIALDGSLFAPAAPEPIVPDEHLLSSLAPNAHIVLGAADDSLRAAATRLGICLHEYENDRELMLLRGPAIVEGAIARAIDETVVTLHASPVGVVGHGAIGALLARTLVVLGARVHVFARNPAQRAAAYAAGAEAHALDDLRARASDLTMLFSTAPARVVEREVLEQLPPGALVMDLAAPPGGVDLEAARELGLRTVWARGLGRRAPVTVGRSQWTGIKRTIEEIEEEGVDER